ncbi:uncharacterized protein Dvar_10360 [Desulfosarcina variabilis str. Montpellier]
MATVLTNNDTSCISIPRRESKRRRKNREEVVTCLEHELAKYPKDDTISLEDGAKGCKGLMVIER